MTDNRKNLKIPEEVFEELNEAREMTWPDQLLYWKRMANTVED